MRRIAALVLLTAAALPALAAACSSGDDNDEGALIERSEQLSDLPDPPCEDDFREVEGLGTACPLEDRAWKVRLDNGATVITHGQDSAEAVLAGAPATKKHPGLESIPQGTGWRGPLCSQQNPRGNYYFVAIIAWPSDVTPNQAPIGLRGRIYEANYLVWKGAVDSGSPGADLVFKCDLSGFLPQVDLVSLSFTKSQATFGKIVSELQARGYAKPHEKYVIWYDAEIPPTPPLTVVPCGEATGYVRLDESPGAGNANNIGPSYGISYDCEDALLHELAHNLGAVQSHAPQATNWWHCWEEEDVMCYNDGNLPSGKSMVTNCPGTTNGHFDCKHDDFFDAAIGAGQGGGPGSYLDRNWNIGGCYVRWVVNYLNSCKPALPQLYIDHIAIFRSGFVRVTMVASAESSKATEFVVFRDNHPIGRLEGESGQELEFIDDNELVPGETYEYRIVGLTADGEYDSNSNVEQVTISD